LSDAALFLEVKQWNAGVTPETPYNVLLDDYRKKKIGSSHPIMSANYVSTIAQRLKEVNGLLGQQQGAIDFLNSTPGFDWNEFYLFLAYQGLEDTPEYTEYRRTRSNDDLRKYRETGLVNSTKSPKCN
jgi:hypothetical protein